MFVYTPLRTDTLEDRTTVIETPCTRICTLDAASGLCIGCGRNLQEIGQWASLSESERARVMSLLPQRLATLQMRPTPRTTA